jgi:predicted Zn-dependent peptidase
VSHQDIQQHTFPNGLTLLAERMPHVRSAAFSISVRAGCAYEPADRVGLGGVLTELIARGAGSRGNRELTHALDSLGLDRSDGVGNIQIGLGGSLLARNLAAALDLYSDILRRAHLPVEELESVKNLAVQEIQALDDEPQAKVMVELQQRYYPEPFGRDNRGSLESIEALTIEEIRTHYQRYFQPDGMIVSAAGDIDWAALNDQIGRLFGDWKASSPPMLAVEPNRPQSGHIEKELDQTQIGIAYPSVPMDHPEYYAASGAAALLSQGMSSRLFSEVREKYGLCYAISVGHDRMKGRGDMIGYTAGRPEVAQELLDRTLHELRRLADGIEDEELLRVKAGVKSSLIMRQESTWGRASTLASDWYMLGRVRPTAEIQAAINALTPGKIVEHLHNYPAKNFTVVTLGPKTLTINH